MHRRAASVQPQRQTKSTNPRQAFCSPFSTLTAIATIPPAAVRADMAMSAPYSSFCRFITNPLPLCPVLVRRSSPRQPRDFTCVPWSQRIRRRWEVRRPPRGQTANVFVQAGGLYLGPRILTQSVFANPPLCCRKAQRKLEGRRRRRRGQASEGGRGGEGEEGKRRMVWGRHGGEDQ